MPSATKRVSVDFSENAYEDLQMMQSKTGTTSISAVIRDALRYYAWIIEQSEEGYTIAALRERGTKLHLRELTPLPIAKLHSQVQESKNASMSATCESLE